jgi:hypothetical protein
MPNENQTNYQANNQTTSQANQANQGNQAAQEPKTIINGKVVPLSVAQAAEQQAMQQSQQTGIQQQHDNNSEAVQAGQQAQNATQQQAETFNIRQANVQSGQSHLDTNASQATQQQQQTQSKQSETNAKLNAKAKMTDKKAD